MKHQSFIYLGGLPFIIPIPIPIPIIITITIPFILLFISPFITCSVLVFPRNRRFGAVLAGCL